MISLNVHSSLGFPNARSLAVFALCILIFMRKTLRENQKATQNRQRIEILRDMAR